MNMKAIGYARVSTADQAARGASLEAQAAKIRAYATMHDLELMEIAEDAGVSAKSLDRPAIQRVLTMIRQRKIGTVIVAKLDRLTRSVRDLGELIELFNRSEVNLASVADHLDTGTAAGRLVLNVMGSVSQWEREAIAERTSEALQHLRKNGKRTSRWAEFGLDHTEDGLLVENASEQATIAEIVEMQRQRVPIARIARTLTARGVPTKNGAAWSRQAIYRVLRRNEAATNQGAR